MKHVIVDNIKILYNDAGKPSVNLFADACRKSIPVIYETWGLKTPAKCKIYIMTSWLIFLWYGYSWPKKFCAAVLLLVSSLVLSLVFYRVFPLGLLIAPLIFYLIIIKLWFKIAGLTIPNHTTCGIKSPDLVDPAGGKLGRRIRIEYANSDSLVQSAICHELTHAFSIHLNLPVWLNEGIAMYAVDKFTGKATVKTETLEFIENYPHKKQSTSYSNLMSRNEDSIVYTYARAYWLTRYLELNYPGFIRGLLVKRQSKRKIEQQLSLKTGIPVKDFWNQIDNKIVAQFTT